MKFTLFSKPLAVVVALSAVACFGQKSKEGEKEKATPASKPVLKVDASPVTEGPKSGVIVSYADVVEPVQKAVVSVYSSKLVTQRQQVNPLFRQFFGDQAPERQQREQGLGSGVIVSSDGYILTNNHVVEDADELNVSLPDDREYKAKLIGSDPRTDVAVIKIEAEGLPVMTLSDSDKLRVGDVVFAVGNPLGIGQTVTSGIVSALGRNNLGLLDRDNSQGYENFIQTDAAINMGNSGGALVDAKGRLVGINTAIVSTTRGNIGIGFAIPVNLAATIMHSLIETGKVSRGFLGVSVDAINSDMVEALGLKKDARGVIINHVEANSPAEQAGLKRGDVILSLNDRTIASTQELRLFISQMTPGTDVKVKIVRVEANGKDRKPKERTLSAKLVAQESFSSSDNFLEGVSVEPISDDIRRRLNLDERVGGLVVTDVTPNSPFANRVAPNMIILEINGMPVPSVQAAASAIERGKINLFLVVYRNVYRHVAVPVR